MKSVRASTILLQFMKFHGISSNSCTDISCKSTNVHLMVELEEKVRKSPKSVEVIVWGPRMSEQNLNVNPLNNR